MNQARFPFVSIIMPIRNEQDFIDQSLGAVLNQDYPHDHMEVLIADGMSDDETRNIVIRMAEATSISIVLVDNPGKIVPTGFNCALRMAKGDIVVRVDGHTVIEKGYVLNCVKLLESGQADNVGGKMSAVGLGLFGSCVAIATSSPFGVGGARFHYSNKEEYVDTVYMGAWYRCTFDQIGMFDEELVRNQDDEFNYRLRSSGGRILLSPCIKSEYFNRSTMPALWRQYYQYGLYKVRVLQKHPHQMRPRQFVPAIFVGALMIGTLMSLLIPQFELLVIGIATVYLLANVLASILTAAHFGWKYLTLLPLVFATLHFSYGLGSWHGLVKFRNRWGRG